MSLSAVSIQRPVFTVVFSLVIIIFGCIGYTYLGVREYPNVDPAVVTVTTNYTGSNSDIIDSQITQPLEEDISSVAGIRTLSSVSREGRSQITIEFELGEVGHLGPVSSCWRRRAKGPGRRVGSG